MGLASSMSTSLTGLNAAETTIDVVGNNLANSNTVGFKASTVSFATQFLQTQSLGSAPTAGGSGGTNPRQTGLGTMVVATNPNFSQGTIQISNSATDMAIQGDGFFIVQGVGGAELYTRNGVFKLNSTSELVSTTGNRLLGYAANADFEIVETGLTPLTIPIGSASVAKATQKALMEGTLSPTGDLGDTSEIIRTDILGDAQYTRPEAAVTTNGMTQIPVAATLVSTANTGPSGLTPSGDYNYEFMFFNPASTQYSAVSAPVNITLTAGQNRVSLSNLPVPPTGWELQIYRTQAGPGANYHLVKTIANAATSYTDSMDDTTLAGQSALPIPGANPAPTAPALTGRSGANYYYKTVGYDPTTDTEGMPSAATEVNLSGLDNQVLLDSLPPDATGKYTQRRIYRTLDGGGINSTYYLVGTQNISTTTFTDTLPESAITTDASNHPALSTTLLTGNYSYYVTFLNNSGKESRPSNVANVTITNGRVQLSNIPIPTVGDPNQWTKRKIYRNADGGSTFYEVTELDNITPGLTYTDTKSDAALVSGNTLNFDGRAIDATTLLTNLIRRTDGTNYEHMFAATGKLAFTGQKGNRNVATKEMDITAMSTVGDLITFMTQALGIQNGPDIPKDKSGTPSGGTVVDSRIRLVANTGTGNAIGISLAGLQLTTGAGQTTVNLPFTSSQQAKGESASTDFVAYDSKGIPIPVHVTAVLQSRSNSLATYRWYADSSANMLPKGSGVSTAVGTGTISFDGLGNVTNDSGNNTIVVNREDVSSATPLSFNLDFSKLSGLAAPHSTWAVTSQDGSAVGVLSSFIISEDGLIRGVFSNGISRDLGQIVLARFGNPAGLEQKGQNLFAAGINSGNPVPGRPNQNGIGSIVGGATELSNTDIGANLIDLILASTMYRGNSRVITTVQQMFDELLNLRR